MANNVVEFPFDREINFSEVNTFLFITRSGRIFSIDPERNRELWDLIIDADIEFYLEQ